MKRDSSHTVETRGGANSAYVVFSVNGQTYAVEASCVREITGIEHIVALPHTAPFILGVTKIHGVIYSVADLRIKLSAGSHMIPQPTIAILIVSKDQKICMVVDKVVAVIDIDTRKISIPSGAERYVLGVVQVKSTHITLLSVDYLLAAFCECS